MGWKNWPGWLKAGIVAAILVLILIILSHTECYLEDISRGYKDICLGALVLVVLSVPLFFINDIFDFPFIKIGTVFWNLIHIFVYFVIAAFISLIIGKIKSAKRMKDKK